MPGIKRSREDASSSFKKPKNQPNQSQPPPAAAPLEVDFPRGGGTGLTPLEFRETKREARAEAFAQETLFTDASEKTIDDNKRKKQKQKANREKRNDDKKKRVSVVSTQKDSQKPKLDHIRIENLNYKRLVPGSKLLCSVLAIHPFAVVVSLPNQLLGHIPVTQISSQFTQRLQQIAQASDEEEDDDEESENDQNESTPSHKSVPELQDLFYVGQWLRASVLKVHSPTAIKGKKHTREGGEYEKESRRVELSLVPQMVNSGVSVSDLNVGSTLSATVSSVEDHGYILDTGIDDFTGFLSFKEVAKLPARHHTGKKLEIGSVVEVKLTKIAENQRTFEAIMDPVQVQQSLVKAGPSVTAILPGMLVKVLVTASLPTGLNVKLFGMFDATIDRFHLPELPEGKEIPDVYKEGSKHNARVLWDLLKPASIVINGDNPDGERQFGVSMAPHVVKMLPPTTQDDQPLQQTYPIGTTVQITVTQTQNDWGLICRIDGTDLIGFVHIAQVSDDHVVGLPANVGPYKIGSHHPARVTGHSPADRVLQLCTKPSILERTFMRVSQVTIGEVLKATIKKVSAETIFLRLNGNVDGVVFPNHFSDIHLKNPEKKFKAGATVKARVLDIDPTRNRILMTLKKTLVSSDLSVVGSIQDARSGVVTHATVAKIFDHSMLVNLYGGLRALVPASEVAETYNPAWRAQFNEGKVVKIRLTNVDYETQRITASIRQTSASFLSKLNVDAVEVGEKVSAKVAAVHKDVVVLTLVPSEIRALISLSMLASMRQVDIDELRESLEENEQIDELVVVAKNAEKGIVICADRVKPGTGAGGNGASIESGAVVTGRVVQRADRQQDCLIQLTAKCKGVLHLTDTADDFSNPEVARLPVLDQVLQCFVLSIKNNGKRAQLSTRPSRLDKSFTGSVVDPEVVSASDLRKGSKYRGFVKAIVDSGLFVSLGRNIVARVQIREMFDDFIKDWKPRFAVGQVVEGTVMDIDLEHNKVEFSLKREPGSTTSNDKEQQQQKENGGSKKTLADFKKGDKVKGSVRAISEFGVFVQIEGTNVSGLCHKSELSDSQDSDAIKAFHVTDRVRAIVLDVSLEKKRIAFGLKPSYFDAADFEDSDEEEDEEMNDVESEEDEDSENEQEDDDSSSDDGDFVEMDEDEVEEPIKSKSKSTATISSVPKSIPSLTLSAGFSWSAADHDSDDSDVSDTESVSSASSTESTLKKKNKNKKAKKQLEEDLTADLATKAPESNTDFERLLLGSPNSSFLWIQFMSFQLQLSDIDKAREIARRALKAINFREEQEKLNVWIALLNLENTYGTQETLETTLKEAVQANDGLTVYLRMIAIFETTNKIEKADEMFIKAKTKFGFVPELWIQWNQFLLRNDKPEQARALLQRSRQSLEKRDHVKTITSFALNEFKFGDAERGRTIFEGLVDSYPKRLDLWWQYLDQEVKIDNFSGVRNLFERVLTLKLTNKKGKSIFKKWLEFEKRKGDKKSQQKVLERARQFVEDMQKKSEPVEAKEEEEEDEEDDEEEEE